MKKGFREVVVDRYRRKAEEKLELADVISAINVASNSLRTQLTKFIKLRHKEHVGRVVLAMVDDWLTTQAATSADVLLAEDTVSERDLDKLFKE